MTPAPTTAAPRSWLEELRALAPDLGPGLFVAEVQHDAECPLLLGRGVCACDFDIIVCRVDAGEKGGNPIEPSKPQDPHGAGGAA